MRGYNKARIDATAKQFRERKIAWARQLKSVPCSDCGITYHPECMDFDHVRGEKKFALGAGGIYQHSLAEVLEELNKCEVVCSNCHRIRTATRAGRI